MATTETGRNAEKQVAAYLEGKGHKISELNWRTRWCEVDVISTYKGCVFFTEVKYRSSTEWGGGFDYIDTKKLRQMHFAAEFWLNENGWQGESCLQAAEVDDFGIDIVEVVE